MIEHVQLGLGPARHPLGPCFSCTLPMDKLGEGGDNMQRIQYCAEWAGLGAGVQVLVGRELWGILNCGQCG